MAKGTIDGAKIELGLIKGLELGGFVPVVLADRALAKFYRLAGVREFVHWDDFIDYTRPVEAERLAHRARGVDDVLGFEHAGARVGKFALSSTFRTLRAGRLDFAQPAARAALAEHVASGMRRAEAAHRALDAVRPDLALFMGNRYSGQGELMDVAIERGADVITWFDAHRSSSLMLKRYSMANRDQHHGSLSDATWELRSAGWHGRLPGARTSSRSSTTTT